MQISCNHMQSRLPQSAVSVLELHLDTQAEQVLGAGAGAGAGVTSTSSTATKVFALDNWEMSWE